MAENNDLNTMQQVVPGKKVTLSHIIVDPAPQMMDKIGLPFPVDSIGIMDITPGEASIVAADLAVRYTNVILQQIDRNNGSVIISGDVESVMKALNEVKSVLCDCMGFEGGEITMT